MAPGLNPVSWTLRAARCRGADVFLGSYSVSRECRAKHLSRDWQGPGPRCPQDEGPPPSGWVCPSEADWNFPECLPREEEVRDLQEL